MAKMGRPTIEIDWNEFDKLCQMQCTLIEISSWFNCSEDTIERRVKEEYGITFAEHYKQKAGSGKVALRRKQMQMAMDGDKTLLIWLGKQYLGQSDKQEIKGEINVNSVTDLLIESGIDDIIEVSGDTTDVEE